MGVCASGTGPCLGAHPGVKLPEEAAEPVDVVCSESGLGQLFQVGPSQIVVDIGVPFSDGQPTGWWWFSGVRSGSVDSAMAAPICDPSFVEVAPPSVSGEMPGHRVDITAGFERCGIASRQDQK